MVFKKIYSVTGDGDVVVNKYQSDLTGMQAVIAQVEGPIVNGYMTFATEAHDDDGIPHTLEHLCFLGSEDYPFKGVLDLLANRCLASGSNAWTDTDHTCYTCSHAGMDGFLQLLPIYLDHLLYPTLTDSGYTTEVHHVTQEGEDAGVVYCEMQARENNGDELCNIMFLRSIYPGRCGYKSNTGGCLKDIRNRLSNQRIRDYHAEAYRPENLCVIVTGTVLDEAVLETLSKFEKKILLKRQTTPPKPYVRPWLDPVPPFTSSVEKVVEFPSDDDDNGLVLVGWRGPSSLTDFQSSIALGLLADFLNDNAASPLQQTFVEREDPYCSSVDFCMLENAESCMYIEFEGVNKDRLFQVKDTLFALLDKLVNSPEEILDMQRMKDVIHKKKLQHLSTMESSPHYVVASAAIGDFLYGHTERDMEVRLRQIPTLDFLTDQGPDYWIDLAKRFIIGKPYVVIIGKASPELMEKMSQEEKERIKEQREKLGEEGLAAKGKLLAESKAENDKPPPKEMLFMLPVPTTENINYYSVTRFTNESENGSSLPSLSKIPFRIQVDDLKTNFVTMKVLLNASDLDAEKRLILPLFCQLLTESAIQRNGTLVPYEDIVTQLSADTIASSVELGIQGHFASLVILSIKVEQSKYLKGIQWLRELIFQTQFTEERIQVVVKRMLSDFALLKRKGNKVASDLLRSLIYVPDSNEWASGMFRQVCYLKALTKRLASDGPSVVKDLNHVRQHISQLDNIIVHVTLNQAKLREAINEIELYDFWFKTFLPPQFQEIGIACKMNTKKITKDLELIAPKGDLTGVIAGVGAVESNYMQQVVSSIKSYSDPDYAPVIVAINYLTQLEGPMWKKIRGLGLSYHYNINLQITEGLMTFLLFKSSHLAAAYQEAFNIVERHVNGQEEWEQSLLESARASLMYELIQFEKSIPGVSSQSLLNHLNGLEMNYLKNLVDKVSKVTLEEVKRVVPVYLLPLFDVNNTRRSVVCHSSKVIEVLNSFKE